MSEHTTHFNSFRTVALFRLASGGLGLPVVSEKIGEGAIFQRCAINMLGVRPGCPRMSIATCWNGWLESSVCSLAFRFLAGDLCAAHNSHDLHQFSTSGHCLGHEK